MILCDIGNSTFHFLMHNEVKNISLDDNLPNITEDIYFISVNEEATKKFLEKYKNAIDIEDFFEFKTSYSGMGIDRKVACFGYENCIIVDAGSAITIDILEKEHKGGFILAGIKNLNRLYKLISSKLDFDFSLKQNLDKIPKNTQEAITYGAIKATILPIKEISENKRLVFTGGDGKLLSKFFKNSVYKKDLIFENMKRIIDAYNCITKR